MEGETSNIINLITNYGALGLCLGYFLYKDNTTTKKLKETLQELKEVILALKERVD